MNKYLFSYGVERKPMLSVMDSYWYMSFISKSRLVVVVVEVTQSVQLFVTPWTVWFEDVKWSVFFFPHPLALSFREEKDCL